MTVTIMIVMVGFSGKLIGRFGIKSNIVLGLLAIGGALVLFTQVPADENYFANVLPASLLAALGMALAYIPITMAAMSGARPEETGLASGLVNTTYQVGSAIGLAIMVALAAAITRPRPNPPRSSTASTPPSPAQRLSPSSAQPSRCWS